MSLALPADSGARSQDRTKPELAQRLSCPKWLLREWPYLIRAKPEDILEPARNGFGFYTSKSHARWRWIDYAQRLVCQHGAPEALRRLVTP